MYSEYWGLKELPFENVPDSRFFYHSAQHEEGLSRLQYAVENKKGAAMLTGIYGCGKTVIAKTLIGGLKRRNYQIAFIDNPQLKAVELLRSIARRLGAENLPDKFSDMSVDYFLEVIENILINNFRDGRETLVIIDEAHVIVDLEVLEQLRMLLNFQLENRFLLTLILMGQSELQERVSKIKQLLQRVALSFHIGPLSVEETSGYISHRLAVSGSPAQLFEQDAVESIFKASGGIPRRINNICDLCLFVGSGNNFKSVDSGVVETTMSSFEL